MALYEYACSACHTRFERLRPMSDGAVAECPQCGTEAVRVLSLVAATARGEGEAMVGGGGCCGGACGCG